MANHYSRLGPASVLLLALSAGSPWAIATDADRAALQQRLIGFYRGSAPDAAKPGAMREIYHKIIEVEAPRLGSSVLYHQIARDSFDSTQPMIQKFYVFDGVRDRDGFVSVTPYSVKPGSLPANLESQPQILTALTASQLQTFPANCALNWRYEPRNDHWIATPASPRCRYLSAALGKTIVPELRYELTSKGLDTHEVLRDTHGRALFPESGQLTNARIPATTVGAIVAQSRLSEWRLLAADRVLRMELASGTQVWIELVPELAPQAVANILILVREKYFDGLSINRVQDNFVAQWSDADGTRSLGSAARNLPAEFTRPWSPDLPVTLLQDIDGFAPQSGFFAGVPVAGDRTHGTLWGAHCYGTLGVGRDNAADSGNGSELYVVIGHAPRQLDRNVDVVGRVIRGIEHLSGLPRGTDALGMYATAAERQGIRSVRLLADLPQADQIRLQALRTDSPSFAAIIAARRNRRDDWYHVPAGHVDLCNVPLPTRVAP